MQRFTPSLVRLESRLTPAFVINSTGNEPDGDSKDGIADTGLFDQFGQYKGLSGIVTLSAALGQAQINAGEGLPADTISFGISGPFPASDLAAPAGWSITGGGAVQMKYLTVSGGGSIHDIGFATTANLTATGADSTVANVFGADVVNIEAGAAGNNVHANRVVINGDNGTLKDSVIGSVGISATGNGISITGNTAAGINASGNALTITGNTIAGATFNGIRIDGFGTPSTGATVAHNTVRTSGRGGISINNVRDSTVDSNTVSGSANNGIELLTTSNIGVFGNTVSGGTGSVSSGIFLNGQFSDPTQPPDVVQGNTITGSKFVGLRAIFVPSLTLVANTLSGNSLGINVSGRKDVSGTIAVRVNDNVGQDIVVSLSGNTDSIESLGNVVEKISVNLFTAAATGANGRITISDNQVSKPDGTGEISVSGSGAGVVLHDNTVQSQIYASIDSGPPLGETTPRLDVRGNTSQHLNLSANGNASAKNVAAGNTIDATGGEPGESGAEFYGSFFTVTNNTVRNSPGLGVLLFADDSTFSGNTVSHSGWDGVRVGADRSVIGAPYGSADANLGNSISFSGDQDPLRGNGIVTSASGAVIRLNSIFMNKRLGIDNRGDYADRFRQNDGTLTKAWHPTIIAVKPDTNQIKWMLNAEAGKNYKIDVYSDPGNGFLSYAEGETTVLTVTVTTDANGHAEFFTNGPTLQHITATATAEDGVTSEFSLADFDGDGLADVWETTGIDLAGDGNTVIKLPGANLRHKDVYVEVDAMVGYDFDFNSMQSVVKAFARVPNILTLNPDGSPGITLHYDTAHQNTGLQAEDFGPESGVWGKFQAIKQAHFGDGDPTSDAYKARSLAYRYCIFAQTYGDKATQPKSYFSSGLAEARGNDFMVTLGSTGTQDFVNDKSQLATRRGWADHMTSKAYALQQAGTFMHELGHTLGLDHTGPTDWYFHILFPSQGDNYFSVMNYKYQSVATTGQPTRRQILDYSRSNPEDWSYLQYGFQESHGGQGGADAVTTIDDESDGALEELIPGRPDVYSFGTAPVDPSGLGVSIPLTFTIANAGVATAAGTTLTVTLPAGLSFVSVGSSVGTPVVSGSVITLDTGTLGIAASATLTAMVTAAQNGTYTVGMVAASTTPDGLAGNEAGSVVFTADANSPPPPATTVVNQFAVGRDRGGAATVSLKNADNTVRFTLTPFGAAFSGGIRTAAADITGDGVADLICASGPGRPGEVRIFDGFTQAEIPLPQANAPGNRPFGASFTRGVIVAAGDLNADGLADLIITAEAGGGARVRVFQSTRTGFTQRSDFIALIGGDNKPDSVKFRGGSRATVSDINGDGVNDLIWAAGAGGGPRIATFDGSRLDNGSNVAFKLTGDFFALATTLRDGCYLAGGDLDGDGVGDLVAGGGSGAPPQVVAYSGKNLIQNKFVRFLDFSTGVNSGQGIRVAVKDVNADGRDDLIVGSAPGAGSRVTAFNGKNLSGSTAGTPLFEADAFAGFTGGIFVG